MKINFFAGENLFIYGRKFNGIRKEISGLTGGGALAHGRR